MWGARTFVAALAGAALLVAAVPAAADAAAFRKYVACGVSDKAKPSRFCKQRHKKGAFFRSNRADVFYAVCVRFPTKQVECKKGQRADRGQLYVNRVRSNIVGRHVVFWFVKGKRAGRYVFFVMPNNPRNRNRNQRR